MLVLVLYVSSPFERIMRYSISVMGSVRMHIPELMRSRFYKFGISTYAEDNTLRMPRIDSLIEFDKEDEEWFIVEI